jgi:hypothetical protein
LGNIFSITKNIGFINWWTHSCGKYSRDAEVGCAGRLVYIITDKSKNIYICQKAIKHAHCVTRIRPSICIGKEQKAHHLALSTACEVHHNLFNL